MSKKSIKILIIILAAVILAAISLILIIPRFNQVSDTHGIEVGMDADNIKDSIAENAFNDRITKVTIIGNGKGIDEGIALDSVFCKGFGKKIGQAYGDQNKE